MKGKAMMIQSVMVLIILAGCKKTELVNTDNSATITQRQGKSSEAFPHTKNYSNEVATAWYHLLANISKTKPYGPPPTIRIAAYMGLALYESVLPGMPSYQSMFEHMTGLTIEHEHKKDYYWPAAANAAMASLSSRMLNQYTPGVNPDVTVLEASFNARFQAEVSNDKLQLAIEFGKYVADKIFEWSLSDGTFNANGTFATCAAYVPNGTPGSWTPTPPGFLAPAGVCQGSLRTFMPGIQTVVLPHPPPAYSTDPNSVYYTQMNEVYQNRIHATADDLLNGEAWRDRLGINYNTPAHMLAITANLVEREKLNLQDASVLYAKVGLAMFDGIAAAFYAKYHYTMERPITYIQNVMGITSFNSQYPTIQHPSYPAVAPEAAASVAYLLQQTFGDHYSFVDDTQKALYGSWNYSSLSELVNNVGRSRSHTGLNYQMAVTEGIKMGNLVGKMADELPFKKP